MPLNISHSNENCLIQLDGEFTIFQASSFYEQLVKEELANQCANKALIIKIEAIEEIDSCAIQLLLSLYQELKPIASSIHIENSSDKFDEAISLLNLHEYFNLPKAIISDTDKENTINE